MTVSIANMATTWMSNSNVYNAISMSVSTMGYGANANSNLLLFSVDGNTVFTLDTLGDIIANTITVNTILANNSANGITTGSIVTNTAIANTITANTVRANQYVSAPGVPVQYVYNRVDSKDAVAVPAYPATGNIITSLNTTITPRMATSNVLITACISYEVVQDTVFRLYRSIGGVDTLIGVNVNDTNQWSGTWLTGYDADTSSTPVTRQFFYMDNPATTSPVTYKIMIQSSGSGATTFYLNRSYSSAGQANYEVSISQIMLQELSG